MFWGSAPDPGISGSGWSRPPSTQAKPSRLAPERWVDGTRKSGRLGCQEGDVSKMGHPISVRQREESPVWCLLTG